MTLQSPYLQDRRQQHWPTAIAPLLRLLVVILVLQAGLAARAAAVAWTNAATAVWSNAVAWNPNGIPTSANDYTVSGAFTMQSVDNNASYFTNNSVSVLSGATIYLYRSNSGTAISATNYFTNTVAAAYSPLTISNAILKLDSSLGTVSHHIKGPVTFKGTNAITYGTTDGYTLDLYLDTSVAGSGSLNVTRGSGGGARDLYLNGDCSGYSGGWTNTGSGSSTLLNLYANSVSGWGSGNVTLNAYSTLTLGAGLTNPAPRVTLNSSSASFTVNTAATIGSLSGVASSTATLTKFLTLADNTSANFSGTLTGAGGFVKNGTGTFTVPNASLNTSTNAVNAGTLIIAGSVGSLTVNHGATLAPGAAAFTAGTLNVNGNLAFNTNILNLDISASPGSSDLINVSGNLTLTGVTTVNLNLLSGTASAGPYEVMTYSGTLTGGATNFSIVGSHSATLDFSVPNQVNLWFTNGAPRNLTWVGDGTSNSWDAGVSFTWFNGTAADYFGQGDNVSFTDSATNLTVNVNGTLSPGQFRFANNTNNYVLQGSGVLSGGVTLVKDGTAALTVSNANSFTGGATISSGAIFNRIAGGLGTGVVTLGDTNTGTNIPALYVTYKETFTNAISVTATGTGGAVVGCDQNGGASGNSTTISGPISLNQSVTLTSGNQGDRMNFSGVISGTGNVTLSGGYRLDLAASNTFTGNLYITGSNTLFETFAGGCVPAAATVDVGPGSIFGVYISQSINALTDSGLVEPYGASSTLTVGADGGSGNYSGILTNNGAYTLTLVKTGSGTQTLSGADYRTAATTISGGTLALGSTGFITNSPLITVGSGATFDVSAQSAYALNSGQTLAGVGSVNGNVTVASNAVISPAGAGVPGTITFNNNLTLGGGSVLAFDLTNNTTAGSGINDLIQVTGNLNLSGYNVLSLPAATQAALIPGTYQLIGYSGSLSGGGTNLSVAPVLTRLGMTVDTSTPNQVNLIVTAASVTNITWTGGQNGNAWDVEISTNWFNGTGPDFFYQQDGVSFTSLGASNPVVSLATTVYPSSVTVNATNNYTFTGAGLIAGGVTLTKNGSGTLYLQTTNTFTGGINVSNGTVELDTASAAGSGAIALGANTLNVNIAGGTLANPITGSGAISVMETSNANTTISSPLSGFTGNLNLPASPGGTAKTTISSSAVSLSSSATVNITNGGTLYLSASAVTIPSTVYVGGGGNSEGYGALRIDSGATISGPVNLTAGAALGVYTGSSTISGNITDNGHGYGIYKTGTGTLSLTGSNSYAGPTVITNGTLNVYGNQTACTGGWSQPWNYAASTVNFESGSTILVATNGYILVGSFPAAGTPNNQVLNAYGTVTNNGYLTVARGGYLNVESGALWVQNAVFSNTPPAASGYSSYVTINSGATFIYNATNTIKLESSSGNSGYGSFTNAGTLITGQGIEHDGNPSAASPILVLNGGVIQLSANIPALTTSALVTTGGVLTVQMAGAGGVINTFGFNTAISNVVSGSGSLTKLGGGVLTLPFTNTYTGSTVVSNGTLQVLGKLSPSSSVTVASNAVLAGTGNIGGATTIQAGGLIQPGAGNLVISNLTLGVYNTDFTTNNFTVGLGATLTASTLNVTGTNVVNILDASLTVGTNNLVYHQNALGGNGIAGFVLGTLPANTTAYLQDSGTVVQLVVTSVGVPPSVTVTPASTNLYAGGSVVFTASASGTAPLALQWYDNLTNAIVGATNITLTLTNLTVTQSGNYTIRVTNSVGSASALGALTVNPLVAPTLSSGITLGNGAFQLTFSGPAGETYHVLSTTNLNNPLNTWLTLTNGLFGSTPVNFVDSTATNNPQQFYLITAP